MRWVALPGGILLLGATLIDVFRALVMPRATRGRLRLSRFLFRPMWRPWRWVAVRRKTMEGRERVLATAAPFFLFVLDARAGSPPSGPELLYRTGGAGARESLSELFGVWERWAADVLETHLSYPLLAFFRSPHDNTSWVTALGSVLDAATLTLTAIED